MSMDKRWMSKVLAAALLPVPPVLVVLLGLATPLVHAQQLSLMDVPPAISQAAEPNLVVTFDNSHSMYFGFAPDAIANDRLLRGAKSSHYNKLFYDPQKTYLPPLNADGTYFLSANFLGALPNPFNGADLQGGVPGDDGSWIVPTRGTSTHLGTGYEVRWSEATGTLLPRSAADAFADEPETLRKAYYYRYNPGLAGCVSSIAEPVLRERDLAATDACYELVMVDSSSGPSRVRPELALQAGTPLESQAASTDERQNFANWYQYYSLRILAAKTMMSHIFAGDAVDGSVRVAYQSLSDPGLQSGPVATPSATVRPLSEARTDFYEWFFNIRQGTQGKALRSAMLAAGEFFRIENASTVGPYHESPWQPSTPGNALSCRSNYHLVLTSGEWSGDDNPGLGANANADNQSRTLPDGVTYPASSPLYRSDQSSTLADIAFAYWATDLSPLRDNVPALYRRGEQQNALTYWDYLNDPARWQHLTLLALSLGGVGNVPVSGATLDAMLAGGSFIDAMGITRTGWPDAGNSSSAADKVDDLYHAAINSRGSFFDALGPAQENVEGLMEALTSITSMVNADHVSYLPLSINAGSVGSDTMIFRAEYNGRTRAGDIKAFQLATGRPDSPCAGPAGAVCTQPAWQLNRGGYHGAARAFTYNPAAGTGVDFSPAQFTAAMRDQLRLPGETDDVVNGRIDYLRGSDALQVPAGTFRERTPEQRTLGPVVNSAPVFVGNGFNANGSREMGYPDSLEATSYDAFLAGINERPSMLYVGSNDGKLHAINAQTGEPVFDYIPNALLPSLREASQPTYIERAGVDGQIATADAYFGGSWRSVLVGGLRTGGQAYYALDITDPASSDASARVLWELTPESPGAADLGFSYSRPLIVKSNDSESGGTRWVAIFGNGYNSREGEAVLFIVDIETGAVIRTISTRSALIPATPQPFVPNGLNTPAAVFADSNFTADYVYAGDLRGNLWKFDLSSSDPNDWKVAYGTALTNPGSASYDPEPLFIATDSEGNSQPITAAPAVGGHAQGLEGLMVYVGTGKYLEPGDNLSTGQQSFYGIWDRDLCDSAGAPVACIRVPPGSPRNHIGGEIERADLVVQQIATQAGDSRQVSDNAIDWASESAHSGWLLDLPADDDSPAERVIAQARLRAGLVLFPTFIPADDVCGGIGTGWLMALSRNNGGLLDHEPFVSNRSSDIDGIDDPATRSSGRSIDTQLLETTVLSCGERSCIVSDELGNTEQIDEGMRWGRWQWQMLLGAGD